MFISPIPLSPSLERLRTPFEVSSSECVCNTTLAHPLESLGLNVKFARFIRKSRGRATKLIVLDGHLLGEVVLLFHGHFHFHHVSTVHPDVKRSFFHRFVHLTEQKLAVFHSPRMFIIE